MSTAIIVQARIGSSRLPGKVLKTVLGKPLLAFQIERLKRVKLAHKILVATTVEPQDDVIVKFCEEQEVACFRGSQDDVLSRYYFGAQKLTCNTVVRVTSDCPLIDPAVIDLVIKTYQESEPKVDYVSNTLQRSYPRGMDTEVFSFKALEKAHKTAKERLDREHVTRYIYTHSQEFSCQNVAYKTDFSEHRWTVDTPEDFALISHLLEELYPVKMQFTLQDLLDTIGKHPKWSKLNAHIEQKK